MKRELIEHIGTTILNVTRGSHYGGGTDSSWCAGEVWTHVYGPYFIYCNNISNTITDTNQAAQALYADALAQAAAERPPGRMRGSPACRITRRLPIAGRSRAKWSSMTVYNPECVGVEFVGGRGAAADHEVPHL